MRHELRTESSAGISFEGISFGQKALAIVVSVLVTAMIVVVPLFLQMA